MATFSPTRFAPCHVLYVEAPNFGEKPSIVSGSKDDGAIGCFALWRHCLSPPVVQVWQSSPTSLRGFSR